MGEIELILQFVESVVTLRRIPISDFNVNGTDTVGAYTIFHHFLTNPFLNIPLYTVLHSFYSKNTKIGEKIYIYSVNERKKGNVQISYQYS